MKIKHWCLCLGLMVGLASLSVPVMAAAKKSYDIYSWPQADTSNFCYAFVPSSKEPRAVADIKASKTQVCGGRDDLKRIIGQSARPESKLTWRVDEANGFILPPLDIVNDMRRFAETIPYTLVVPEPK